MRSAPGLFPSLGWLVCGLLAAVVGIRWLRERASATAASGSVLALSYDALPLLLLAAWPVAVLAAVGGHWFLTVMAGGLIAYHVGLLAPRLVSAPVPHWVRAAPRVRLLVANVFVDNETPDAAARQIVASGADVAVIVESTSDFMAVFDRCEGSVAYPHRIGDPDTASDYAITIVSRAPLGPRTEFRIIGDLRLAIADVGVGPGDDRMLLVALNPKATVDEGGQETWTEQLGALERFLPTLTGPVVVAGDLNTTRYRPEFERILQLGFVDAIDALGKGISPSFKLVASNALTPLVRLDHALTNPGAWGVSMHNLEACGSDHLPFEMEVAVRTDARMNRRRPGHRRA